MMKVLKAFFLLFTIITLTGCLEREIYTEIVDKTIISHPPKTLQIEDQNGMLKTSLKNDPDAAMKMTLYIHCSKCDNAQSKSLGTDFDGYIRITISDKNHSIARAQMDYKGEATRDDVEQVYEHLMQQLQW